MRNTLARCAASLLVLSFPLATLHAAKNSSSEVEAREIALKFKDDPKGAETLYRDKMIQVSGTLQQVSAGDNVTTAAVLLLATNPGLPLVRVEMTFPREAGTTYEFRAVDGQRLEYRTRRKDFMGSQLPAYVTGIRRTSRADPWVPLLQKGETVSMFGLCKGRAVDVMMREATLLKNGWNPGNSGGALAGSGSSSGGSSYDPNLSTRLNDQANARNQVMQQNQQINQASAQRDFQSTVQRMNQTPAYTPPAYTPPAYTPPAYQPPAYRPPPGG